VRSLGEEFYRFDAHDQTLTGSDSGVVFALGSRVTVKLSEVSPVTGGILLELLTLEDHALPRPRRSGKRGAAPRRKLGQEKARAAKDRQVSRRRK
jgi:ribonuclease R